MVVSLCLQPAPIVLPTIPDCVYSLTVFSTMFPTDPTFPDRFPFPSCPTKKSCSPILLHPDHVPDLVPNLLSTRSPIVSRLAKKLAPSPAQNRFPSLSVQRINRVFPFFPVNQMASHLPVPFPSRGKQTGTFPHPATRKYPPQKKSIPSRPVPSRPARCLHNRAYPSFLCVWVRATR